MQTSDTVLEDFGAGWLYARYLADQFGSSVTSKLVQTSLTGTDNGAAQTGIPFATTVTRWALANWVSDLPGFAPPAGLFYRSWSFRSVLASSNQQDPFDFPRPFPLVPPVAAGGGVNLAGTLHAGSGFYLDIRQPPLGGAFTLRFETGSAQASFVLVPRLAVIRLR